MHMVKVISLSEEAYTALRRLKREGMSFSDVVVSVTKEEEKEKTETIDELLVWVKAKSAKFKGKKGNISQNIDSILYGA